MIKVPAHRKFSRKTSNPFYRDSFNCQRKSQNNRSSIMINGQSNHQFIDINRYTQTYQTYPNTDITFINQSPHHPKADQSQPNHKYEKPKQKYEKNPSIKLSYTFKSPSSQASIHNKKFKKIDNRNSTLINNQQYENKMLSKTFKLSSSNFNESIRSSAMKKIPKYQTPFPRNTNTIKASIFHDPHNNTISHKSDQYQEFLKQSNLHQLAQQLICKIVTQNEAEKQNKEITDKKSMFFVQDQRTQKQKNTKIINLTQKSSKNLFKELSSNTKKSSQKDLKIQKEHHRSDKQIFYSMTQTAIDKQCDKKSQNEKQVLKVHPKLHNYNQQELHSRKEEQIKQAQQKRIQRQKIYNQQTEELFRCLQREIASKEEMQRFEKKSHNYYEEMRQKLMQKYEKIWKDYRMDENQRDKIGLLIEGCNLERHRRVNNFYFENKQSAGGGRIDAAIGQATKDINKLNFINKERNKTIMRPHTSRQKSSSKSKIKHSFEKSSNILSDYIMKTASMDTQTNILTKLNTTYNNISENDTECIFNMTTPNIKSRRNLKSTSTERPKTAMSRDKNVRMTEYSVKQKEHLKDKVAMLNKFDALLGICEQENDDCEVTKRKMKVFEYYCTKIDNGFQKLSQRITDYVANM